MKFEQRLVKDVLRKKNDYADHVGIELEIEGERLPLVDNKIWKSEKDGSLRGESFEYVLKEPVPRERVTEVLTNIASRWKDANAIIKNSPNAGTHVHINVGDLTVTQLFNFKALYLIVEDLLVDQCGVDRVGNLFCLRACDAEYLLEQLVISVRQSTLENLYTDELRYASMNVKALGDYGSLEFRAWRSDGDVVQLHWWIELLLHLKNLSRIIESPAQIVSDASIQGSFGFFQAILGVYARDIPWKPEYEQQIFDSVRRVQQFAFHGDW